MLKFLGTGSAFNTSYGNNSAYIKSEDEESLLLIDCGETVFAEIQKNRLLDGVKHVYVVITHLHGDHIGSLSSFIMYCHYVANIKLNIIHPNMKIESVLTTMGAIKDEMYDLETCENIELDDFKLNLYMRGANHVSDMESYSIIMQDTVGCGFNLYYSGDSNTIDEEILGLLNSGYFDCFYQDTSSIDYEGNVHLSFKKLKELVNPDIRFRVTCMHLDGRLSNEEILREGFQVAKKEF